MHKLYKIIGLAIFSSLAGLMSYSLITNAADLNRVNNLRQNLLKSNQEQKQHLSLIQTELQTLDQPLSQEKIIRDVLLYQRPGEQILQLPDVSPLPPIISPSPTPTAPNQAWRDFFSSSTESYVLK